MEVSYQLLDGATGEPQELCKAFTRNIGVGGAFIVTDDPAAPGSELRLTVQIPTSGKKIDVRGEVRWIADGDYDAVHGMGVKFHGLDVDQLLELNEYFTSLTHIVDHDE